MHTHTHLMKKNVKRLSATCWKCSQQQCHAEERINCWLFNRFSSHVTNGSLHRSGAERESEKSEFNLVAMLSMSSSILRSFVTIVFIIIHIAHCAIPLSVMMIISHCYMPYTFAVLTSNYCNTLLLHYQNIVSIYSSDTLLISCFFSSPINSDTKWQYRSSTFFRKLN